MGVNIDKMKKRQEVEDQKAAARAAGGFNYWKPSGGDNRVRFMPPWTGEGPNANDFARELYVHWNVGPEEKGATFSCPIKTPYGPGGECPVCAYVKALRATEDPNDAEMASDIRASQRFYSNIVDLSDSLYVKQDLVDWKSKQDDKTKEPPFAVGETKIQVFSYGPMIFKEVLDILADGVDITDLATGWDIKIKREGQKLKTRYRVSLDAGKGACPFDFTAKDAIDKRLVNLDALMPPKSVEDMADAVRGMIPASQTPAGAPPPQLAPPAAAPETAPEPAGGNGVQMTPAVQVVEEQAPEVEAEPPCFKDTEYFDETDAECVGGIKGEGEEAAEYEPCPFFEPCKAHCKPEPVKKKRRGRRKAAPAETKSAEPVDELEADMKTALKG